MKTQKYIATTLMMMFIGISLTNGQRSIRAESKERSEPVVVRKTTSENPSQQRTVQRSTTTPAARTSSPVKQSVNVKRTDTRTTNRTAQPGTGKAVDYQRTAEPPRTSNRPAAKPRNTETLKRTSGNTVTRKAPETRTATSTVSRPAPENRPSVNKVTRVVPETRAHSTTVARKAPENHAPEARPVRTNKYSKEKYYSGRLYHNVYPTNHIEVHNHHDTYIHHYHVLYYPTYHDIYWNRNMYRDYCVWYPNYHWNYNYGYRIQTISVFDAKYRMGEVAMIYGRVSGTWYNGDTDDYLLFFGGEYPYQQFTVVLPGKVARRFSWRPENYFLGEHMTVTGLITTYDGIPEVIVKNKRQVGLY